MAEQRDYLTVTTLTKYLRAKFERDPYLERVYLTGEISNFRLRPNAHQYFSLKDDHAKINAIMFRSAFNKVKFTPEEGMKVLVVGRISLYEPSGSYQIYVERMEPDGVGAFYQAYEQLKKKLAQEGLFSAPKRPLVRFPKRIAVVTSPSGAVIRDIITTTRRRFPIAQLVLFPTLVQGNEAAADIVVKIEQVNQLGDFDTLIVGRGGGSIEDLWPFNEEIVARAIAASQVPVISSVGHETDTTIADLVADVRAATPTAAAELAVPVLSDEVVKLQQQQVRLLQAMQNRISLAKKQVERLRQSYVFRQPQRLYDGYLQNVDQLNRRLQTSFKQVLQVKRQQALLAESHLQQHQLQPRVQQGQRDIARLQQQLAVVMQHYMTNKQQIVQQRIQSLDYLSPLKIMGRGYSYVTDEQGNVLKQATDFQPNTEVALHVTDAVVTTKVIAVTPQKQDK
ncbi:exodeoxyribonuclease VII large subunit [Loigolactobacillus coryniformis]|uniref:Exodeoxyribonuclease 7 large subunit n=1 Tax=Loigolactobacillus coryniformis subsp. torquens DSM 20004 = KCTC 3535 TaxID=1423822 RepID=A0A2D1KPB8_9LACO|nr:exodeoxyribonuclease VII large subunit [Loigolactobacillus coryniformis]ATO43995.1 exodeoxyribonuclease VII large subunit [Loigolactobacillus coryniformis subsp. torquens DSM 20004 = KCTC 3535]KRK84415.1 exodeoxyribonuclease VII large subunit [Loigolactobacillus coryniformis subsp. torquens DSM 20004 = KCTC 3535]